ncbi:glycosyltransferase family 4 protein [Jatrophihabitans sp.]|uniref:glycosyltransferase family 4 protein n=1 Tax=Jatrophihabitans sp. TaxID=1932789 RepID=UPI0030C6F0D8|nr:glycosyl transferase group 1 [Jatrophihabitans sp.]
MRIGIVCPYSWDIPGGVQAHVKDLAEKLIGMGHSVSVLAPGDDDMPDLPPYVVAAGKAMPIPYNGSVARLQFGLVSAARVRRWLRDGDFDVVHVHEPAPPSLSLLTLMIHDGPLVATFHAATVRSRFLSMFETALQPFMEKLSGRIAVSPAARKVIVEHLDADAVVIPNGVEVAHYANAEPLPGYPREGGTVGFVGRYDEPRKGMDVLVEAFERLVPDRPGLKLLVAGRGEAEDFVDKLPPAVASRISLLGQVSDADKARLLRSIDVYCAPNTGQESFGVILLEAMAARTPIVASDLEAFRRVLAGGAAGAPAGELFAAGDPAALAVTLGHLLDDAPRRAELAAAGVRAVAPYDWEVVVHSVLRVYELAIAGAGLPPGGAARG